MADIYVDIGPMSHSKDSAKVAANHAKNAKKLMQAAAKKAVKAAAGFTPEKVGNPKGFHFDATLTEVKMGTYQGQPSVTCKVNGLIATFPQKLMITKTLTGETTFAGSTTDRDVEDCIKATVEAMVKDRVIPALKKQPKP